jgi:hypothetical protein
MKTLVGAFGFGSMMLAGCGVARDAAVTSYHVATAPVRLVARQFEDSPPANSTTSDVDVPGHPVAASTPKPMPRVAAKTRANERSNPAQTAAQKSKTAPNAAASTQPQFPVATPVPGKPGYVFSPYDGSKYVDVSGYTSGSKVKDPYAQKIFVVP